MPLTHSSKDPFPVWTIADRALRWHVCLSLCLYGLGKWVQFNYAAEPGVAVKDMSDMEVMWAFYGRSKAYALVIGACEIAAGLMLLLHRTKLIGALLATTVLLNVILQDIFYGVLSGALLAAVVYQVELVVITWLDRDRLLRAFSHLTGRKDPHERWPWWSIALLTMTGVVALIALEKLLLPTIFLRPRG